MPIDTVALEERENAQERLIERVASELFEKTETDEAVVTIRQLLEVAARIQECLSGAGDGIPFAGSALCRDVVIVRVHDFTAHPVERSFLMARVLRLVLERVITHYERPYLDSIFSSSSGTPP